jgi:hypothetical protein
MGEISSKSSIVDVTAPKFVAFIGAIAMICIGFIYLVTNGINPVLYIITGISCLAGGVIVMLIVEVFDLNSPIPYKWWLLLAIGGGVLFLIFLTRRLTFGTIFGSGLYVGALLVAAAGLLEWLIEGGKLDLKAPQFLLFIGSAIAIVTSIFGGGYVWMIIAIAACVILILASFDVVFPYEWWLWVICLGAIYFLIHTVAGIVIGVGFLLFLLDK